MNLYKGNLNHLEKDFSQNRSVILRNNFFSTASNRHYNGTRKIIDGQNGNNANLAKL